MMFPEVDRKAISILLEIKDILAFLELVNQPHK